MPQAGDEETQPGEGVLPGNGEFPRLGRGPAGRLSAGRQAVEEQGRQEEKSGYDTALTRARGHEQLLQRRGSRERRDCRPEPASKNKVAPNGKNALADSV